MISCTSSGSIRGNFSVFNLSQCLLKDMIISIQAFESMLEQFSWYCYIVIKLHKYKDWLTWLAFCRNFDNPIASLSDNMTCPVVITSSSSSSSSLSSQPHPLRSSGGHCTHRFTIATSSVCVSLSVLSSPVCDDTCRRNVPIPQQLGHFLRSPPNDTTHTHNTHAPSHTHTRAHTHTHILTH